jgi:hypothetical protein
LFLPNRQGKRFGLASRFALAKKLQGEGSIADGYKKHTNLTLIKSEEVRQITRLSGDKQNIKRLLIFGVVY